jgi:hypothetical protein
MKTFMNLLALAALAAAGARADIVIALDDPDQTGTPGETLNFFGTITNASSDTNPADAIYFNSDSLNLALSDATINDNFFAAYFPISLVGGQSSGDIDLFDVVLANPETDPFGTYSGTYELLGGADGGTQTAEDVLAQVDFSVDVEPAPSSVPEPSALVLLGTALLALMTRLVRARTRSRA